MFDLLTSRCIPIDGYFDNLVQICVQCPLNCLTCKSSLFCTSCLNGTFLSTNNLCETSCPPRYYGNTILNLCQNCPYDCYTCNGDGTCLTCNDIIDHRYYDSKTMRCIPMQGYCEDFSQNVGLLKQQVSPDHKSKKCPIGCKSCKQCIICTSC